MTDELAPRIGPYALGELSGSGGTASVFAAVDERDGARVALKVLHPRLARDAAARRRFLAGAEHGVDHPNVVAVREAGEHVAGDVTTAWIALDWAEGVPLARRVRTAVLDAAELRELADGMLSGLAAVHAAGLVHRDVSLTNLLVPPSGAAMSADAIRLIDVDRMAWTGSTSLGADALGADPGAVEDADSRVVATPASASPEQLAGRPLDRRSDLFSAAAVLFAAATGHPPYTAAERDALVRGEAVPPPIASVAGADVPIEFDRALASALAGHPLRRPRDAEELRVRIVAALPAVSPGADAGVTRVLPTTTMTAADRDGRTELLPRRRRGSGMPSGAAPVGGAAVRGGSARGARSGRGGLIALVAVVAGLLGIAVLPALADPGGTPRSRPTSTPTGTPTPQPSASATVRPRVPTVALPALAGMGLAEATSRLAALGIRVGVTTERDAAVPAGTVVESPARAVVGGSVDLVIASGRNTVPPVGGLEQTAAVDALRAAGFGAAGLTRSSGGGVVTVAGTDPVAGTSVALGTVIELLPAPVAPAGEPTSHPTATPDPQDGAPTPTPTPSASRSP